MNSVAPRVGAHQQHDVAGPVGARPAQPVVSYESHAHRIDDGVVGI